MSEGEENIFGRGNKTKRTPVKNNDTGFCSNFLNISQNLEKIENAHRTRRSVSFSLPSGSSTFYVEERQPISVENSPEKISEKSTERQATQNIADTSLTDLVPLSPERQANNEFSSVFDHYSNIFRFGIE